MNAFWVFLSVIAFGLLHSLLASLTAKALARQWLGRRLADGLYRLFYNLVAALSVLPPLALAVLLPDGPALWRLPAPLLFVTIPLQLAAVAGMIVSLWRVDLPRFVGVRQLLRLLVNYPDPRDLPVLRTDGVHGWVRHPLYFFSLVLIWLLPVMTPNFLALNVGVTLYFWIGSIYEERKLVREFGEVYRAHQARVPRLLPWLSKSPGARRREQPRPPRDIDSRAS
ncbi:MAG TPA: isoprenylcysteine carboxylmethyltransferase family protein [Anaerolineales bacterium]|nr:isoprenylcysteine carboxylmethyltransferase family protein [Anaerolineales bacterium]